MYHHHHTCILTVSILAAIYFAALNPLYHREKFITTVASPQLDYQLECIFRYCYLLYSYKNEAEKVDLGKYKLPFSPSESIVHQMLEDMSGNW